MHYWIWSTWNDYTNRSIFIVAGTACGLFISGSNTQYTHLTQLIRDVSCVNCKLSTVFNCEAIKLDTVEKASLYVGVYQIHWRLFR